MMVMVMVMMIMMMISTHTPHEHRQYLRRLLGLALRVAERLVLERREEADAETESECVEHEKVIDESLNVLEAVLHLGRNHLLLHIRLALGCLGPGEARG